MFLCVFGHVYELILPHTDTEPVGVYLLYMNILKTLSSIAAILFGVFMFIFGGYDDSPGAQGLGLLLFIFGIVWIVRGRKNN